MGVLLKMRSIFFPHHFWGTANLNLNLNLNLTLNRNFNFRNFCYDNICLITSILTWKLKKCPHKPTEKLGQCHEIPQHCDSLTIPTTAMSAFCKKIHMFQSFKAWLNFTFIANVLQCGFSCCCFQCTSKENVNLARDILKATLSFRCKDEKINQ